MTVGRNRLVWKKNRLYNGKVPTNISVVPLKEVNPNSEFENMYKIKIEKSVTTETDYSTDFYNLTRAKDNAVKIALSPLNKQV